MAKPVSDRKIRKENNAHQSLLLSAVKEFLEYRLQTDDEMLLEAKLDQLDRRWKKFVANWNRNPKRHHQLRKEDFLLIVSHKLSELEAKQNAKKN